MGWANNGPCRGGEGAAERCSSAMLLAGQSRSPDQQRDHRPKATTGKGPCSLQHCSSVYAGTSHSTSLQPKFKLMLKSKYGKAWRDGRKRIEIRKVTDVAPNFQVGWIIDLQWLGLCRVKEVVWFLCKRDFLAAVGLAHQTGWAGTGVRFEERGSVGDDDSASDASDDFLKLDRKGFKELEQCGITANDFAARNVSAFNIEFLTLCGDSEMRVEADDANEDDE